MTGVPLGLTISQLAAATTANLTDEIPVTQGSTGPGTGVTRRISLGQIPPTTGSFSSVIAFGAKGDGLTDDTAAIQLAENSVPAGTVLYFPAGTYLINQTGVTKRSGISWLGSGGSTLKAISGPTWTTDMVVGAAVSDCIIQGITFDWNNVAASGVPGCFHLAGGANVTVENCRFIHLGIFGLILDGITEFFVRGNYFQKDTPARTQNQSLLVSPASGVPGPGIIDGNISQNTAFDLAGADLVVSNNFISGWSYGSGITVGPDPNTNNTLIANNICNGGIGTDENNTTCTGIENWSPFSTMIGNVCIGNAGDGLDNNALNCTVVGNVCLNNGQDTSYVSSGIGSGYESASQCGNFSVISGNVCSDLQTVKTQKYGYQDRVSTLTDITVEGNSCFGNATAPMNIQGVRCDFHGPKVWGSAGFGGGTIAPGTFFTTNVTVGGSTVGDQCVGSASFDLGGAILFAWCHVPGTVQILLQNASGSPITVPAGTFYVSAEKRPNYVEY